MGSLPSTVEGWTAAGVWSAVFILLGVIVRQIGPWRKQSMDSAQQAIDAAQRVSDKLNERVNILEARLDQSRKEADDKIEKLTAAYDLKIEKMSAGHDAVVAIMRHRVNNLTASLEALLLLLEQDPSRAAEAVARIREMRARQTQAEAVEKAALHANRIGAVTGTFTLDEDDGA